MRIEARTHQRSLKISMLRSIPEIVELERVVLEIVQLTEAVSVIECYLGPSALPVVVDSQLPARRRFQSGRASKADAIDTKTSDTGRVTSGQ